MSRVRDWVDSNFRAAYKVIFGLCLFSLCLTLNIFADDSTKHVFLVIVDDDFSSQADVDIYNSEHGTSFVWQYDAFASIQPGIDSTIFGGTVNVQPGTYAGNINIDQRLFIYGSNYNIDPSGSLDRGNESVILGNVTISSASAKFDGFTVDGYNIIIEHVDDAVVSNNICLNTPGVGAIQALTEYATSNHSNRAYIGHNTISNAVSSGIYSDKNQDIVVEYNHIFNIIAGLLAGHGIMCDDGFGTGITIRNNIINTVGGIGISFEAGAGVVIENNQVTNAQREGIFLELNTGDYTVRGNTISYAGLNSGYGIRSKCRTKIENNSIDHCEGGIKADYFSSGETDRIEIKGNSISYIELAGIFVGSSNAYIYNNALLHCHIKYGSSLGPWDLASIHIGGNAKNSQVIGNVVFDGINGIQTWSDSTTISNNVIYGFGYSHDVFNIYATSVYKNSAILIGSNWIENNFNPEGTIIFNNSIHDNYFDLYYHDSLTYTINASGNWWGSIDPEVISSLVDDSTDFTPWLKSETDLNPGVPGFQGNYSQLVVGDGCIQTNSSGRIQEAIDMVTNGGTVNVLAGYYGEDTEIGTYWDSEEEGAIATGDNKTVNLF
ncbi:MAG: right-handed parallel beta-helix repeat-containing protein, partial [Candidatus Zixiibacteriota bacterium]